MNKKIINYIIIGIMSLLILILVYFIVDKYYISNNKMLICEKTVDYSSETLTIKIKSKFNSTGAIVYTDQVEITKYDNENSYNTVIEAAKDVKDDHYKYDSKKLTISYIKDRVKYDVSKGENLFWYLSNKTSLEDQGYKCKIK